MNLSEEERERYSRHLVLKGFGTEAQLKLKASSVLVVGAGGLGCPCLLYLVAAGVGHIGIADGDVVTLSNLQRQVLYNEADVGKFKAETARNFLQAKNSSIRITAFNTKIHEENVNEILIDFDLVIDGSDNFSTRYLLNDACVILNKPLVSGALFEFEGQLSTFNYKGGPTYRCLFPNPPQQPDFAGCGETGVLGVLPGIIGTYQASEALKVLTGIGEVLSGKLLVINLLSNDTSFISFKANSRQNEPGDLKPVEVRKEVEIKSITPAELDTMMQSGPVQLIDVREEYEYERFNIGGINLPFSVLEESLRIIEVKNNVILICQTGSRSAKALISFKNFFPENQFYNLEGGLNSYLK